MSSTSFININHSLLELRFGKPVLIKNNDGTLILIAASEVITDKTISLMKDITGSNPTIIITKERYSLINNIKSKNNYYSISNDKLDSELCHLLSYKVNISKKTAKNLNVFREDNQATESIISLLKYGKIVPSFLMCNFSNESSENIFDKSKENNLFVLNLIDLEMFEQQKKEVSLMVEANVPLKSNKNVKVLGFRPTDGSSDHFAFVFNNGRSVKEPYVRIHSQCITGDLFHSLKCDCGSQLNEAINFLSDKNGIILYMSQEGRDIGFLNKMRAYSYQEKGLNTIDANNAIGFDTDQRDFEYASSILKSLKLFSVRLISNNPDKKRVLEKDGIKVIEVLPLKVPFSQEANDYINIKKKLMGHSL
ncbi:MAG: hypothetical protein CMP38_06765 [Rickettsiales bacterium]|nr:hypothetical protein [Rickettsiales bacterium]|tara:strand:+ start:331 stop:1425 length:1095 start_codon:yes stop_codon:yes gene_type:complete